MSIRWDSLLVRHLAVELDRALVGSRLRAIRLDARSRDLALLFRERTLLWRLHPDRGSPEFREVLDPEPTDLRLKARVRGVTAPPDERIVLLLLESAKRGVGRMEIVVELMGNQLNALVTEGAERRIRHVLRTRAGRRPATPGIPYVLPTPTSRLGVDGDLSLGEWVDMLAPIAGPDRPAELVRRVAWTSPFNASAWLGTAAREGDPESLSEAHTEWQAAAAPDASAAPHLINGPAGPQPYPIPLPGLEGTPHDSLLSAFAACARMRTEEGDAPAALAVGPDLLALLQDAEKQLAKRVVRLQAEYESREPPGPLRAIGDLILARYADIPGGASVVTLEDFAGGEVVVELDPKLAPHDNAAAYYARAGRSERAAARLPGLIDEAVAARDRMSDVVRRAVAGELDADAARNAVPRTIRRTPKTGNEPTRPYRTFRSSGGLEIRVGRGARHNDVLTFKHSNPNDIWLHARHVGGAHVVLRWSSPGNPPSRDLEEAGALAALHSKARTSASVPVDWTLRKYVRKPRGAAPGSVVIHSFYNIFK